MAFEVTNAGPDRLVGFTVPLPEQTINQIDALHGDIPRLRWVRPILESALAAKGEDVNKISQKEVCRTIGNHSSARSGPVPETLCITGDTAIGTRRDNVEP